jgi:hypothetical protein
MGARVSRRPNAVGMKTPPRLDPIEIFRPGTFISEEGDEVTVTTADCAAMVAAYDPTTAPAPIVIGHPATDAPAYGWIESMSLGEDDIVRAIPGQVEPGFASDVRAGRYKKVSARFYPPGNRHNPNPGVFSLRHVGALGAHPPAVKGLKNLSFAEGSGESGLTFDQDIAAPAATNSTDTTTQTETQTTKEADVAEKKDDDKAFDSISFAEARDQLAKLQAKVAEDRAALLADRAALEQRATDASHKANVSFVEGAVAAAKIANPAKEQFVFLLDRLSASPADISFGEGEKKQSPADLLKSLITAANPLVSFGEFAKDEGGKGKMSAMSLSAKASKYQAEQKALGNIISTAQAVRHVEMEMA